MIIDINLGSVRDDLNNEAYSPVCLDVGAFENTLEVPNWY